MPPYPSFATLPIDDDVGCVCGTFHLPQHGLGGTGIVDKTGGYVGLASAAGPPISEITLTSDNGEALPVWKHGVVCGVVESAASAEQFESILKGSHSV